VSKDPLEELFGPISEEPEPAPVQARERLSYEQAERVRTAQLQTTERGRSSAAKPWIVVGAVAAVAIVLSIVVVNLARGSGDPEPAATTAPTATKTPSPSKTTTPTPEKSETPEEPKKDAVPKVEVGPTSSLPIPAWGVSSELSQKFGSTSYSIPDNTNLRLESPLINSLPESCAAMRTQWGAKRLEDGTFEVAKPADPCADAPELYDELWGLTDAFVQSFKPL
jgi:hypothetical protein